MKTRIPTTAERVSANWGRNVQARRKELRITQVQMAGLVHRDQTTVSRFEMGKAPWTPDVQLAFAIALDTTVEKLFPWPLGIEDSERFARIKSHTKTAVA